MSKNKILDSIFQQFLDGKRATVESEGLYVEGKRQDAVTLKYHQDYGLICLGNLSANQINVSEKLKAVFSKERERLKFSLETHEKISSTLDIILQDISVNYATISVSSVKNFETTIDEDGNIQSLKIFYQEGSLVKITIAPGPLR